MSQSLETDCRSVKSRLDAEQEFLLLDCREQDEWDTAKIEGAQLIPMSEIQDRLPELEPYRDQPFVVYCHHGMRSLRVVNWLRSQDFSQAQSMVGGIDEWSQTVDETVPRY